MLGWLGAAMVAVRKAAGKREAYIADQAGVREGTVVRWERGENLPRNLDPALTIYARLMDPRSNDSRLMWERALALWREHDENRSPTSPVEAAAVAASAGTTPPPDAQSETPAAKPSTPEAA